MDYGVAEQNDVGYYGGDRGEGDLQYEEENRQEQLYSRGGGGGGDLEPPIHSLDGSSAGHELKHSIDDSTPSAGKLFVGGIAWETSEECFNRYFSKYGEVIDSVIMMDKVSGRPRGFGFITFADPEVANRVLQEEHVIDGRVVEVKRTVPREDTPFRRVSKTKKIFVGGIPPTLTEDELKEYFSSYGSVVEHQIMLDHNTGRSRGFGFVTFDNEDAVQKVLSDGRMHELNGKQVEIKRAEPKRAGGDRASEGRMHRGNSNMHSYGNVNGDAEDFGSGYGGKMRKGYGGGYDGYGNYGPYGNYAGNYGMGSAAGFYGGYGGYGYGYGFGGSMYGAAAGYSGNSYVIPGNYGGSSGYAAAGAGKGYANTGHGGAKGYGSVGGDSEYDGGEIHGSSGNDAAAYGGAKGYGGNAYGNDGAAAGRFHPYRK
ncbi:PREDICTED: heterogeneous nuclear ribonucleoprotein 1 [Ipomoea nil]|uniref:heterogeneous nuclear ribonucleoprotein 1 n=1 Tax=Ipomoea nil TaxID=35883 RepID=UPI000900DB9D|nr:PREDICTED: heterogeneous nuclear ribonucleoprotein 1 [Ipomoea nil]XP_019194279.1 PREDICTED: heterogeneous nuclear ribonucleoprotein 1 [Ipomoea nil]